ncbi:cation diffusion facilitator family transporter, partial [Fervidibacter sacchari]
MSNTFLLIFSPPFTLKPYCTLAPLLPKLSQILPPRFTEKWQRLKNAIKSRRDKSLSDHEQILRKRLWIAVGLTSFIFLAELIGGLWTRSLALLSDSFHVLTDAFSLVLTLAAIYLAMRPPSDRHTFGLHRLEIFAAAFNAGSLLVICFWLALEAIERLLHPQPILAKEMLVIAIVGFVANIIVISLLHSHMSRSLNVRSAVLHVIGDTASSVGVIVAGAIMALTGWFWVDPLLSLLIVAVIGF